MQSGAGFYVRETPTNAKWAATMASSGLPAWRHQIVPSVAAGGTLPASHSPIGKCYQTIEETNARRRAVVPRVSPFAPSTITIRLPDGGVRSVLFRRVAPNIAKISFIFLRYPSFQRPHPSINGAVREGCDRNPRNFAATLTLVNKGLDGNDLFRRHPAYCTM